MYDNVYLVTERLRLCTSEETSEIKSWLPVPPAGYEAFLQTLGVGEYCDFLTVWPPAWIPDQLALVQSHSAEYVSSLSVRQSVPDGDFSKAIPIAMTKDGDYLVVLPQSPEIIFAVARQDLAVYVLPDGFNDLLNWKRFHDGCQGYTYVPPFRYFESEENREHSTFMPRVRSRIPIEEAADFLDQQLRKKGECRRIDSDVGFSLFPKSVQGHFFVSSSISMTYDKDSRHVIAELTPGLNELGFFEQAND